MKVIIVEDEPRVRKGLSEAIEWSHFGMELIGTAANGMEGLELFKLHKPKLVIADIRMPVMDGLAMTEAILEIQPQTKVVVISGHDEFVYAQKCISLGVTNYLLKPIGKKRFQTEIEELHRELTAERKRQEKSQAYEKKLKSHLPILRNAYLEDWLTGASQQNAETLKDSFAFLDIPLAHDVETAVAIFELDWDDDWKNTDGKLLEFAMNNIIEELVCDTGTAYQRGNGQAVVIFQSFSSNLTEELSRWTEQARLKISSFLKVSVTAAVSTKVVLTDHVPQLFKDTIGILRLKRSLGTGTILDENLIHPQTNPITMLNSSKETMLIQYVEMNDEADIRKLFDALFEEWRKNGNPVYKNEISFQFAGIFTGLAHRLGKSIYTFLKEEELDRWRFPEQFRSLEEMKDWWQQRFIQLSASYEGFRSDRKTNIIQQVMNYVDKHIFENITREDVADHVDINSSYLSRMFKQVTGESFSDYVISTKMKKALELLQVERAMVYEVADRLGYKDPSYFARVFKKYTGKSPSDFQE